MPKYLDVDADSFEWKMCRVGIPTSSCFDKLITPKKLEPSASRFAYQDILLAEWITGMPFDGAQTEDMWNGKNLEPRAIAAYETLTDIETKRGGFVTLDSGMAGCSPDRLVGDNGGVEIKNRQLHVQIGHIRREAIVDEAKAQVQGTLLITEREWWDLYSHNDLLITPAIRVYRDDVFLKAFRPILDQFIDELLERRLKLERDYGPFVRAEPADEPPDHSRDFVSDEDVDMILEAQRKGAA
jgi:hypothetical protein